MQCLGLLSSLIFARVRGRVKSGLSQHWPRKKVAVPPACFKKTANRAEKMVVIHERGGALANISSPSFFYHPNGVNEPQFHYEAIEMSSAAVSSCS